MPRVKLWTDIVVISTALYFFGPGLSAEYEADKLKDERLRIAAHGAADALLDVRLKDIQAIEAQPSALEEYVTEYKTALTAQSEAELMIEKQAHYTSTVEKLDMLLAKATARANEEGNVDAELVESHILQVFSADKKILNASVDECLAFLENEEAEFTPTVLNQVIEKYTASPAFQTARNAKLE